MHELNKYLKDQRINLESCLHTETQRNGLVIIDAYYGLDEHIYRLDAGKLFELQQTQEDWYNLQVIPLKKKLQLMVSNSQLVIDREYFLHKTTRSMFNPCFVPSSRKLLYVLYRYKGIETTLLYSFNRPVFVIPNDVTD